MSIRVLLRAVLLRAVVVLTMVAGSSSAFGVVKTWDAGGGNNLWTNGTNWSPNGVPGGADDVVIDNSTAFDTVSLNILTGVKSVDIGNGATLSVASGGVLFLNGPGMSTVQSGGQLQLEEASPGGVLSGSGTLTVDGIVGVHGNCTLDGSGALTINNTGQLQVGSIGGAVMNISRNTTNNTGGTITFLSASVGDTTFGAVTINNTGLIDIHNDEDLNGTATINNNSGGVLRKSIATGTSVINFTVNNAAGATIETQTGLLQLNGGGTANGAYSIAFPNFMRLGGGTFTMSGTPTVTGGGLLIIVAATLDAGAGVDVTCPNVELRLGGAITGPGTVRVSGTFTWRGGTITGGPRVLNSTSTPSFPCNQGPCLLDGAALQLQASTTYSASSNALVFSNAASLTIDPGKTFSITADGILSSGIGGGSIFNDGTLQKTTTNGISTIGVPVTLSGTSTVDIDTGTLQFGDDVNVAAGATLDIAAGKTLEVTGGMFQLNGSASMPGSGDFKVSSGILRIFALTTIPNLTLQAGIIDGAGDLHVSGNFNWLGGTIVGGGARVLDSTSTPAISCSAGQCILDGTTATLQMNASGTFNATTNSLVFFNSAILTIASGKTLDITTDGTVVGTGTITNNGTITKSGGAGIRSIGTVLHNNGSVTVTSGGLSLLGNGTHNGSFTVTAPGTMAFDGGTHTIAGGISGTGIMAINGATVTLNATGNAGGFAMSGGTLGGSGTLTLANGGTWSGGTMSGSGTTAVAAGKTLTVSGFPTLNGRALDLGAGAMLDITNQRLEVASAANVTGTGTVRVNGGTLRVLSAITQTIPNLTLTAGVADGAGGLHVSGNFNWLGGTIQGSGARVLNSSSTPTILCAFSNCTLDGASLQLQASTTTFSASSNAFMFSNGASLTVDSGKTLSIVTFNGDFTSGVGGGSIVNNGAIWKNTSAGTSTIGVPVTMMGTSTVDIDAGTLEFGGGADVAGGATIDIAAGKTLEVAGGVFLFNSGSVSMPGSGDFKVSAGTLRVPTGVTLTVPNVTLQGLGSVIDGGGTLILSGTSSWLNGTMGSATAPGGVTQIDSGNTLNISSGPQSLTQNRQLLNNGTVSDSDFGGSTLTMSGNSKITNNGAFTLVNSTSINNSPAGSALIENNGTFTVSGGIAVVSPRIENNNGATMSITGSGMTVDGGGIVGGALAISPGATVNLFAGTYTVTSTATVTGAGLLFIGNATLDVGSGVNLTCPNVHLAVGTITGAGTLHVSGTFDWVSGTIAGSGPRVIDSTSTPTISCVSCQLNGAALQLQASATFSGSGLVLSNGASLTIDSGKTLSITNNGDFSSGVGGGSIVNNGTMLKNTTAGTSFISVPLTMPATSTIDLDAGTLQFSGSGGVTVAAGATLDIAGGTTLEVTGGVFLFSSGPVSMPGSGIFQVSGGTLRVPASIAMTIPNATLQGGTVDGGGTLTLSGTSTWIGGTMGSASAPGGVTQINSGDTLNITNGASKSLIQGRELQNSGTVNYGGASTLSMTDAAKITNNAAFHLTTDGNINVFSGTATIDNSGTLDKNGGSGTSTLFPTVNSTGTLSATIGTLTLAGGGTPYTNIVSTAPATIAFQVGTHTIAGTISGTGTFRVSGATVIVNSPFTIGTLSVTGGTLSLVSANGSADAFTMTGGTVNGVGTLTLNNGGTWSAGTISGGVTIINPATKSLGITAPVTLNNGTLQNNGTLSVSANVAGSGTIDNNGTLNVVGNRTIGTVLNNSGQVATSGALSLTGSGTHTGTFTVTSPGILSFSSATHSMSGGGSIGGTGTLTFNGATATVGVPVNVGALSVTAGTATLDANGSADAFTMTGGTLGGSGTLTLNNGGTWSGGTMSGSGTTVNPQTLSIPADVTLSSRTLQNINELTVSGDITGSGTIDNAGTLDAVADLTISAVLNNSGLVTTSNALSLAGGGTHTGFFGITTPGILSFSSGTHSLSGGGTIIGTGTLTFSGAMATVGVPVTIGMLSVTAGTATLNADSSTDAFTMTGGTLGGSGILTLTNGGTWSGGTMSGSGTTVNPAAKTVSISAPVTLSSRTLQNDGTLSVSGNVTGSGTIANNGTLTPVGNIAIGAALNNSGQIATSALFSLGGNGAHSGTFTITAPGVIDFSGGTQTISGTLAGTGTLRFSGAAATVSGTWSGMPVEVTGGSAALNTNGTIPALTLSGGTLTGSGDVVVSGPSAWSGGTLAGSGDFTFDTGATVAMPGTNAVTLIRPLRNKGTVNFTAVSNGMLIDGVAVRNDGTFDIQSSQGITATAGTPSFLNRGTLKKTSGSGVMQFTAPLSNSGLVRIESGTMRFGRAYAQSDGTTTILSGATLRTATVSLNGGSLTGKGTVVGTVANHATVSPGTSPGTLTVSGDYVQSSGGTLEIQLNGTAPGTQYDRLLVSGSVTLGGTLNVTTSNGFTPTAGNAFQIITFSSRTGNSTFDVMNGLNGLVPTFSTTDLQLVSTVITPVAADVAVAVNGPGSTIAGSKVIYTVTVSNSGPDPATNIAVTATASPGLTFSANSGACVGSFPCNIAALGPGQSATIHSAWDIAPSANGSVQLTVNANAAADANSSNNSDSAVTNIGACPDITIVAPGEMTTGLTAEATATGFDGATYHWSIVNGTIDRGDGTASIEFTAGEPGTTTLAVNVTGGGCTLSATSDVTIKARCLGTAMPTTPGDGTVTADAVVEFAWSIVDDASGYRLWLQQDGAPAQNLGTALGTSRTRIIPPGVFQWYVETLFDGCASHESERRTLTILPGQDCASREAPQLSAPLNETPATSAAVAFSWNAVPQALEYELWLALAGGAPTLIHNTSDTSYTAVVPPGRLEWYVRAIFAGCAATESAHRAFTYTPPPQCTSERPLLIAPVEAERLTSPVSFEWTRVSGATSYELYVDGMLAATTTSPHASDLPLPRAERRWRVRARLGENCGAVDSAESRLVVIPPSPSCAPLGAPVLIAPAQISSGIAGRIQWSFVPGATAYEVEISGDPQFSQGASSSSTVAARQLPITFTNQGSAPVARYVRVHAVDTNCVQPGRGAFSPVAELFVLPPTGSLTGNEGAAMMTDPTDVQYTLSVAAELAGQSFTAKPTVPWLSVTPASGVVPPGGQTLRAVAHSAGLPAGTNIGTVEITTTDNTTTATSGALKSLGLTTSGTVSLTLNNVSGASTASKSTPPPDALIIPAVAHVKNFTVSYDSDISVTNTSPKPMTYEITFVPTGSTGMSVGKKTKTPLEPGATMFIKDIVDTCFGGQSKTGTLDIRPLTETATSTSSAPDGGLADRNRTTLAASRTFSTTDDAGTYGQYIPAVPYRNFVKKGQVLSLQQIAQSDKTKVHTNLGLVEGSGEPVSLEVRIFDAAGHELTSFPHTLNGGEQLQVNSVLKEHGLDLDDGRIEVEVTSDTGKVTAYASLIDDRTKDAQLVQAVTLDQAEHSKWVVPGVKGSGNWQTDVRIFNAGTEAVDLTLVFYPMNVGPATTQTIHLEAGKVRQLDRVLSFFGLSGDTGALHVSSADAAQVVVTARTYQQTDSGTFGQFIVAGTSDDAVSAGSPRQLQILQMEESADFQSIIGLAEVSGKPVTLKVTVIRPNSPDQTKFVELKPNQFQELSLASFGPGAMYNARISVSATGGEGQALAYGSLIDLKTGDPTYIPGQ